MSNPSNLREELEELRTSMSSLRDELQKMERCIEQFRRRYEPFLSALMTETSKRSALRQELWTHLLKGTMLAFALSMAGGVLLVVGLGLRAWFKGWLV